MPSAIDLFIVQASVLASLAALAAALRYYRRTRRKRAGVAWLLMLVAIIAIALSESADVLAAFGGNVFGDFADLFGLFAEIALAVGFVRLYGVELAEERSHQERLRQRARQAETLSTAALQLSGSLHLPEVLRRMAQEALDLTEADFAGVYRMHPSGEATPTEMTLVQRDQQPETRPHIPSALSHLVSSTGQPQFIEDAPRDPRGQPNFPGGVVALAALPLQCEDETLGILLVGFRTTRHFSTNDRRLLAAFAEHAALALRNAELHAAVEQLSVSDPLTGLANRRQFEQKLASELLRARRYDAPLSLIILDLDDFKSTTATDMPQGTRH